MTATFTLTGRILDKSKQPVTRARLVLGSNTAVLRDSTADEVYAPPPRVTTDDSGYLCVDTDGNQTPAGTPGVPLVTGVQYRLRGTNRALLGGELVFTAPDSGTLNIADIVPEPPTSDPSWSDALATLTLRVTDLEDNPGGVSAVSSVNAKTGAVVLTPSDVGAAATAHTHTSTQITDFTEAVQDAVAALLAQGTNVTLTYNDAANTLTVATAGGAGGGLDTEAVRDAIGVALVGVNGVSVVANDALDTITVSLSGVTISQVTGLQAALDAKSAVMVVDNGDGTQTITVDNGGAFSLVDNNNGTATLALAGVSTTLGPGPAGRGVTSIARTSGTGAAGTTDTYTITYSDATTSTFAVVNGTNGTNGRGVTSIARTSGTSAPGTTDTYTIAYTDATTSTFTVYNGADGAAGGGSALTVQDEGSNLATSATTINFVGSGVTASGTGATKTVTIPGGSGATVEPTTVPPATNATGGVLGVSSTAAHSDHTHAIGSHTHADTANGGTLGLSALSATGTKSSSTFLRGDNTWAVPAGGGTTTNTIGELPDNVIAVTIPSYSCTTASQVGSSGQLKLSRIKLVSGQVVTSIRMWAASTAGASLTHSIAGLYDSTQIGPVLLASSADDTTATWTANTSRTFTMSTPYTVTTTAWYYVGFMVAGTTLPTIYLNSALAGVGIVSSPPVAAAVTNSGLTTALPATSSSATSGVNAQRFYAEIL